MSFEDKIAEAAEAAAEAARAKSNKVKRKEEAVRTRARLRDLERLAEGQSVARRLMEHERYVG